MPEENYLNSIIQDVTEVLFNENIEWPEEMTLEHRGMLLKKMITFYEQREEYETCKKLENILESLND